MISYILILFSMHLRLKNTSWCQQYDVLAFKLYIYVFIFCLKQILLFSHQSSRAISM